MILLTVLVVYFISSFFHTTMPRFIPPEQDEWALRFDWDKWVIVSRPRIMRGDEMHYLLLANSMGRDGDIWISHDYASVLRGGLEMGYYHRYRTVRDPFIHFTRHRYGPLINKHPWGLSLLLALLLWPLAGTSWMEPATIWVTVIAGMLVVHFFMAALRHMQLPWPIIRNGALLLAFATPLWSYSRTLYTEVYLALGYMAIIYYVCINRSLRTLPLLSLLAWFKVPGLLLFFSAGTGELLRRRWKRFLIFGFVGAAVTIAIFSYNRWFFRNDLYAEMMRKVFNMRIRKNPLQAGSPIAYVPGASGTNFIKTLFEPSKGLLPYTPLLVCAVLGLYYMRRHARDLFRLVLICVIPWYLVHVTYQYVLAGGSYTLRYFIPFVPPLMLGIAYYLQYARRPWQQFILWGTAGWSLACNVVAGIFPGTSFATPPHEMLKQFGMILKAVSKAAIGAG